MKPQNRMVLLHGAALLVLTAALNGACKKEMKAPAPSQTPVFPLTASNTVIPLWENWENWENQKEQEADSGYALTIYLETPDLSGLPAPLGELVRAALYDGMDSAAYQEQVVQREKARYYEAAKSVEGRGASWNWDYHETIPSQTLLFGRILVIERVRYAFTGGAHGNYTVQYAAADAKKNRILALTDVVAADALPKVRRLMEAALRARVGIGPEAPLTEGGLFEDHIDLPENFFLTEQGLGFLWNPYEIAPYVMGALDVVIPYEELGSALLLEK